MHNVIEKLEASRDELKIFIRKLEILATKENLDDYIDLLLHNKKKSKGFVAFVDKLKLDTELKESFVRATINYFKYLQKESGRFDKIIASLRMLSQAQTEMGTMVESAKAIGNFP